MVDGDLTLRKIYLLKKLRTISIEIRWTAKISSAPEQWSPGSTNCMKLKSSGSTNCTKLKMRRAPRISGNIKPLI